ncbi:ankyrin repeat family protein [Orientia tsutsugamushi str. TA763]|nr:ankyrin repeat family protein [Orientia tsutsugamushi str. TA763]
MLKHNSTGINKKYDEGETLLHIAVRNKIIDIIQLLIIMEQILMQKMITA